MKLNPNFIAREIAGELVIVPIGPASSSVGLITTNDVGAFIWGQLEKGKNCDEILTAILNEFDVDEQTASADINDFIGQLKEVGALE